MYWVSVAAAEFMRQHELVMTLMRQHRSDAQAADLRMAELTAQRRTPARHCCNCGAPDEGLRACSYCGTHQREAP